MPHRSPLRLSSDLAQDSDNDSQLRAERYRTLTFWRAAVNATRGLLNISHLHPDSSDRRYSPTNISSPLPDSLSTAHRSSTIRRASKQPDQSIPKSLRKSRSTPSLQKVLSDDSPPLPPFPSTLSSTSKKHRTPQGRPLISQPSLPYPISHQNTKFSYPSRESLSPSVRTHRLMNCASSSSLRIEISAVSSPTSGITGGVSSAVSSTRRRTKSVSGLKSDKLADFFDREDSPEPLLHPPAIHSPTNSGFSTPAISTPRTPHPHLPSPFASPGSISSVKRKPVPRYLYDEPSDSDASSPGPLLQANLYCTAAHAPLLSSSELVVNALNLRGVPKDATLLPIGPSSTTRWVLSASHGRSVSEFDICGIPSQCGHEAPVSDVSDDSDSSPVHFHALNPPPTRTQPRLREETADDAPSGAASNSDDESRIGALSPLTDEEIVAIKSFVTRHAATGQRARQRRRHLVERKRLMLQLERQRDSYSVNAQIFDAYMLQPEVSYAEQVNSSDCDLDGDTSNTSDGENDCYKRSIGLGRASTDTEDSDHSQLTDLRTPVETNRDTFGYYGFETFGRHNVGPDVRDPDAPATVGGGNDDDDGTSTLERFESCKRVVVPQIDAGDMSQEEATVRTIATCKRRAHIPAFDKVGDGTSIYSILSTPPEDPCRQATVSPTDIHSGLDTRVAAGALGFPILDADAISQLETEGKLAPTPVCQDSELEGLSSSFERLQSSLSKLKMHAPCSLGSAMSLCGVADGDISSTSTNASGSGTSLASMASLGRPFRADSKVEWSSPFGTLRRRGACDGHHVPPVDSDLEFGLQTRPSDSASRGSISSLLNLAPNDAPAKGLSRIHLKRLFGTLTRKSVSSTFS